MSARHVVVDGSNIATEGRSLPNLSQLDEAVREFLAENPDDLVTVVVDASFGHRVDPSELPTFEEAEAAGEIVSPPAGAIGRGDAFLLRIAEKIGATVLSNDSFQEFHGEHAWLFDKGRLIGGKPVPGVGWIFMERSPVRGQKSREVVKEAKRKKKAEVVEEQPSGLDLLAARTKVRDKKVDRAIATATQEVIQPKDGKHSKRRRAGAPPAEPVNEPLPFITFIAAHPLGSEVTGIVSEFASHGAFVESFGAKCYIPLSAMGNPPPRRAREVLSKGEERTFVVQALDPLRRGIELALPGFERIAGWPTPETVDAEIHPAAPSKPGRKKAPEGRPAASAQLEPPVVDAETPGKKAPAKKATAKKAPAKKAPAKKAVDKKAPAKKAAEVKKSGASEAGAPKKPAAKKAGGAAEVAKKAGSLKKAAKKAGAPAGEAEKAGSPTKRPAKKSPAKKAPAPPAAPATKGASDAKAAPARKAAAATKAAPGTRASEPAPDQSSPGQPATRQLGDDEV